MRWSPLLLCAAAWLGCAPAEDDPDPVDDAAPPAGDAATAADGAVPAPPSVAVVQPAADVRVLAGTPIQVSWIDADPDGTAATDLFADADGDPATTGDQIAIATGLAETDGTRRAVAWDTTDAPRRRYVVFARTRDERSEAVARAPGAVTVSDPLVHVENLEDGETLRHDLALLSGAVDGGFDAVTATNGDDAREWPVVEGRFKALVPLRPGENAVALVADGLEHVLRLRYTPQTNPYRVRLVWYVGSDGDGAFLAPAGEPNDTASAVARLKLGARLMQTFTAEKMRAQGFGRRTFELVRDDAGEPEVTVHRSASLTTAAARGMDGNALWGHLYDELGALPDREHTKDVVLLSMTDYDGATRTPRAHTALGGDRLALFGSGTLHTWAQDLDELVPRFTDERRIDPAALFDDSAFRETHWANYATGLGATLHELGHCLSLPHPTSGEGVMARAFDHVNRTFVVVEPPSARTPAIAPIAAADETGWDRSAAVRLAFHRWLDLDAVTYAVDAPPAFEVRDGALHVTSAAGLRHVAYHRDGDVVDHDEHLADAPPAIALPLADIAARAPGAAEVGVTVIDDDGNIAETAVRVP